MPDYGTMPADSYRAGGVEGLVVNAAKDFPSEFQTIVHQIADATQRVANMRRELYRKVAQLTGEFPMPGRDGAPDVAGLKTPIIVQQRHALKELFAELDELNAVINAATSI